MDLDWRIYYSDGSIIDGIGTPVDLDPYGVMAILHGIIVEHGSDWYIWQDKFGWLPIKGDASLILKFLFHAPEIKAVLAGESVHNWKFQPILDRAVKDQHDKSCHRPV